MKKLLFILPIFILFPITTLAETQTSTTLSTINSSSISPENTITSSTSNDTEMTSNNTEMTSNNEFKDSQNEQDKVINQVENDTTLKKSDSPMVNTTDPNFIRQLLKDESMKESITPEEVDQYTDQQLLNTMTLCDRMSNDTFGLDVSGYVGILNALYKDHTLSWDIIQSNLNYNPANYQNAKDMLEQIDSLQSYLAALYPPNSSFMPIQKMNDKELSNVLNHISPIQEKAIQSNGYLFPGIIGWIDYYSKDESIRKGSITPVTPESSEKTIPSEPSTTSSETTTEPSTSTTQNEKNFTPVTNSNDNKNSKALPKTGENRNTFLTMLGILILLILISLMIIVRKKSRKE